VVKTAQQILINTLLAALIVMTVYTAVLLDAARRAVSAIPAEIRSARMELLAQTAVAERDLSGQITESRRDLLRRAERQAAALRTGTMEQLDRIREAADQRVGDTLRRADAALAEIHEIRGDLRPVLSNSAALTADAKDSMDALYWDVKASVESATVAANSFGQMSVSLQGALPGSVATWDRIGANIAAITGNVDRLTRPRWYDRLLGYGLNGVILYRNLNPATNLTIKGAQVVSGRP